MTKIWVKSVNDQPVHKIWRSDSIHHKDTEYSYLTITADMAVKGIPVEVPDVPFFHDLIGKEKLLLSVPKSEAEKLAADYADERKAENKKQAEAVKADEEEAEEIAEAVVDVVTKAKRGRKPKEAS
jgi:hypothetical protein